MYTVYDYGRMAADPVRMDAYRRAIAAVVKPGAVVLDIGAGTGIMTLLALRAGAARVHAVEPNPCVFLLRDLAAENGLADRVVVHHASSMELTPPEKVDVVISDMRGATPLMTDHLAAVRDARRRWLAPSGVVVPARDELRVCLVEADALDDELESAVRSFERLGVRAGAVRFSLRHQVHADTLGPLHGSDVLSTEGVWATLEYATNDEHLLEGEVSLTATRGGVARGLSVHFATTLVPGIGYSTAPGNALTYGRLFLPLAEPVTIAPDDRVRVVVRGEANGERWAWDTAIDAADGTRKARFRQATFLGLPADPQALLRTSEHHAPRLSARGERLRDMLAAMDGTRSLREIADALADRHPGEAHELLEALRSAAARWGA